MMGALTWEQNLYLAVAAGGFTVAGILVGWRLVETWLTPKSPPPAPPPPQEPEEPITLEDVVVSDRLAKRCRDPKLGDGP